MAATDTKAHGTEEQWSGHKGALREDGDHCDSSECRCWDDRYQIVTRETIKELSEAVNAFIHQKGWRPLGGVSQSEEVWAQAMVRYV